MNRSVSWLFPKVSIFSAGDSKVTSSRPLDTQRSVVSCGPPSLWMLKSPAPDVQCTAPWAQASRAPRQPFEFKQLARMLAIRCSQLERLRGWQSIGCFKWF